jgi:hypothetical protein
MATARHRLRPGLRYVLLYEGPVSNLNRDRNKHWAVRSKRDTATLDEVHALALAARIPKANVIGLTVQPLVHGIGREGRLADVAACAETQKAALDALVLAQVIPNDTPEHVRYVRFRSPAFADRNALALTIDIIR